jgi:hypothetical protein
LQKELGLQHVDWTEEPEWLLYETSIKMSSEKNQVKHHQLKKLLPSALYNKNPKYIQVPLDVYANQNCVELTQAEKGASNMISFKEFITEAYKKKTAAQKFAGGSKMSSIIKNLEAAVKRHETAKEKPAPAKEPVKEAVAAWQRKEGKSEAGGLNKKGIASYRRENPGSKLSMAVTTKPSKLKKDSKAAKRRKSFCARMGGMKRRLTSAKTAKDPNSRINKALRKWNC